MSRWKKESGNQRRGGGWIAMAILLSSHLSISPSESRINESELNECYLTPWTGWAIQVDKRDGEDIGTEACCAPAFNDSLDLRYPAKVMEKEWPEWQEKDQSVRYPGSS